jgi:hypothetical protein
MFNLPHDLLKLNQPFCWLGEAFNDTTAFFQAPPREVIPEVWHPNLTQYQVKSSTPVTFKGKLAVPLKDQQGVYNVVIFSLADGEEITRAPNTDQPYFHPDGQHLLLKHKGKGGAEVYQFDLADGRSQIYTFTSYGFSQTLYEYDLATETETPASNDLLGSYPAYTRQTEGQLEALLPHDSAILADSSADMIAFTSRQTGDWETYVMKRDGTELINLSQSSTSQERWPTFSPDGKWVAFLSDRGGRWAIWGAPVTGGLAQKLFDLPRTQTWGTEDETWLTERMAWGSD